MMDVQRIELIQTRERLLKQMHQYVIGIGDEDLYWYWITEAVPDEPDDNIYKFIATHDAQWLDCCETFHKIYEADKENNE